ncbi:MAG: hypothetical protein J6V07_05485, partial [Clostridia bacterium]|nr:hypothetical protein [Clostridia bacterium]
MSRELHEIGEALLNLLREQYPSAIFNLWFRDLRLESIGEVATFSIDSEFKRTYLTGQHKGTVERSL